MIDLWIGRRLLLAFLALLIFFSEGNYGQEASPKKRDLPGELSRLHQFKSEIFGNERTIRVLLPVGYYDRSNRGRTYPVLYLNDGQNLFDKATSLFNQMEWQVDETVRRLIGSKEIPEIIVVGIDNAGKSGRANEYLPYPDEYLSPPLPDPQGARYPDFLAGEVVPFINRHYRTKRGKRSTGLGGSSYGALISLYSAIKKPGIFGMLLLESPSFYVSNAKILDLAAKSPGLPDRIYLGVGTNETGRPNCKPDDVNEEAVEDVLRLKGILRGRGYGGRRLKVTIEPCATHNENAWAKRLPDALRFLFKK